MRGYFFMISNRSDDLSRSTSVFVAAKTDALRGPPTNSDISPKNSPSERLSSTSSCPSTSLNTLTPPLLIRYMASPSSPSAMIRSPAMNSTGSSLSTIAPNSSLENAANSGLMSFFSWTGAASISSSSSITGAGGGGGGLSIGGGGAAAGAGGGGGASSTCSAGAGPGAGSGAGGGGGGAAPV